MEYRTIPHGGEKVSVIGLGAGSLAGTKDEMIAVLNAAIENGINYFDLAPSVEAPWRAYAAAFAGRRDKVITQMHFGAVYDGGKYGWTRDLDRIKQQIAWNFQALDTDHTDIGFIHCVDDIEDLDEVIHDGLWDYMKALKADGVIRHLGFSSHDPGIARRLIDTGLIDMCMFSINPAYDYQKGEYAIGEVAERAAFYRDCEKMGVGISVMKPFAGGQLLDARRSVFGQALTHAQCFQYALDRPAVLTVLPGVRDMADLKTVLSFVDAAPAERDYSCISKLTPKDADGICVYCNHCQPCPAGLNIGLINKYYDLAKGGDEMARGHYHKLPIHADACLHCGHCERRCPFHVKQEKRMREIAEYFGEER